MAIKTRNVKQYLVYELVEIRKVELVRNGVKVPGESLIPVAIFDDQDLLNTYLEARRVDEQNLNITLREEWTSIKPVAENFSIPFNLVYEGKK